MASVSYYNGSSWVSVDITHFSYWNGTAWTAPSDVKYWTGSAWTSVFSGGGGSGIALRAATNNSAAGVTSLNLTIPASTQIGDMLTLVVGCAANAATLFNAISGWTKQGEQRAGSAAYTIAVYTRLAQSGDANTVVASTSTVSGNYTGQIRAYSGVNQTTPLDTSVVFSQLDSNSTSASGPAITTVTAAAEVVSVYGVPTQAGTTVAASDFTDPSGFANELVSCSNSGTNNAALATYDQQFASAGAQGPFAITCTQARRWAMASVALRPA